MSGKGNTAQNVVPAQLGFLAIYNPSLGTTDDTIDQQIVYYCSSESRRRRRIRNQSGKVSDDASKEEKNERLRQIGLAQGIVEFGRAFSDGTSVDAIETEKCRIILHELEAGWWLLVSIDLTIIPISESTLAPKNPPVDKEGAFEYSSREVKSPTLLLQDLLRAHSTFLLHHASSMSALFVRSKRAKFVTILGRYWDGYLSTWNVLLHGNPAVNVYGGIKLAASGELGIGVGEEERGSGEREVLEGFIDRTDGLVDLVVSRFGEADSGGKPQKGSKDSQPQNEVVPTQPWLGTGAEPALEDGAIFLGVGALSRHSLRDVTHWMEDLYSWGNYAYGVRENPTSNRQSRQQRTSENATTRKVSFKSDSTTSVRPTSPVSPGVKDRTKAYSFSANSKTRDRSPPQRFSPIEESSDPFKTLPPKPHESLGSGNQRPALNRRPSSQSSGSSTGQGNKLMSYLKLGYGTHWTLGSNQTKASLEIARRSAHAEGEVGYRSTNEPLPEIQNKGLQTGKSSTSPIRKLPEESAGHYLVGLIGDIDNDDPEYDEDSGAMIEEDIRQNEHGNLRTLVRTVTVELERERDARTEADISIDFSANGTSYESSQYGGSQHTGNSHTSFESQDRNKTKKLRVVVYVNKPFIFTFLFELRTDTLALSSLYRSLHYQLKPLIRPLLTSTKNSLSRPQLKTAGADDAETPIYDIIWDPKTLTVSATIPNIPDPTFKTLKPAPWSRIEALSTHTQIMNTFTATRSGRSELERTCKTSRGYWVVWTRIPDPDATPSPKRSTSTTRPVSPLPSTLAPQLRPESRLDPKRGPTSSMVSSSLDTSAFSGPAHPFETARVSTMRLPKDKEIFLVRRASDYVDGQPASRFVSGSSMTGEAGWGSTPAKLAQGIGVDTKRYIEGLLSMNS